MTRGKLITFEGVEGAGKSTILTAVAQALEQQGYQVLLTREPGATELGQHLRALLLHKLKQLTPRAELFLYLADRAEHIDDVIRPAMAAGKIVLCDRFSDSTIAYQGYGRQLPLNMVMQACQLAQNIDVDRTYLLDLEPTIGLGRTKLRGQKADRLECEQVEFHQRVRAGFLTLAAVAPERVLVIDASLPQQQVLELILVDLQQQLHQS